MRLGFAFRILLFGREAAGMACVGTQSYLLSAGLEGPEQRAARVGLRRASTRVDNTRTEVCRMFRHPPTHGPEPRLQLSQAPGC